MTRSQILRISLRWTYLNSKGAKGSGESVFVSHVSSDIFLVASKNLGVRTLEDKGGIMADRSVEKLNRARQQPG